MIKKITTPSSSRCDSVELILRGAKKRRVLAYGNANMINSDAGIKANLSAVKQQETRFKTLKKRELIYKSRDNCFGIFIDLYKLVLKHTNYFQIFLCSDFDNSTSKPVIITCEVLYLPALPLYIFQKPKLLQKTKHSKRATKVALLTKNTPGAIRTRDPLLRRQMLYPAELRTHKLYSIIKTLDTRLTSL